MLHFIVRTIPLSFFHVVRLSLFVVCLAPAFAQFAWYYFIASDRISLPYGSESIRQRVDVYRSCKQTGSEQDRLLEEEYCSKAPVVIFFTGGGWMIGYKMWGALLAKAFTAAGIVVVIPDTRNYPFVYVQGMIDDADLAIDWTIKNIEQYGGDPTNIVVAGQSAGGHIAAMAIFRKIQKNIAREAATVAARELAGTEGDNDGKQIIEGENVTEEWLVSDLKGFSASSSPLSLGTLITQSFQRIGFDDQMVDRMFGFEKDVYDPLLVLEEFSTEEERGKFAKELPPISIYHGTKDKTVPNEVSEAFYRELSQAVIDKNSVSYIAYDGWSHTDLTVEGPMDGDHRFHKDLFDDVNRWTSSQNLTWSNDPRVNDRLCPHFMVQLSRLLNPF